MLLFNKKHVVWVVWLVLVVELEVRVHYTHLDKTSSRHSVRVQPVFRHIPVLQ